MEVTYVVAQTGDDNDSDDGSVNEAVVAGVIAGVVVVLALVVLGIFRDLICITGNASSLSNMIYLIS